MTAYAIKLSRPVFALLIAVLAAIATWVGTVNLPLGLTALVMAIIGAVIVFLTTEEQEAPAVTTP